MDVRLVTYNEQLVTPLNDALIYEKAVPNNGIFYGYDFSISGNTTIAMEGGKGLLYGREFESQGDDIDIELSTSGVLKGRLYLHMDLANISEPIQILSQVETTLPALIDNPDVNRTNGVTELELCTFDVGTTEITNLVKTVPTIKNTPSSNATSSSDGLMSAADKAKLDGIATGANKYTLPTASSSTLGGIKVGTNLSISSGVLSAKDTTYSVATTSANGLMSKADKSKLDGIQASANNIKSAFGAHNCGTFTDGQLKTVTVSTGKPSGTIVGCIPLGSSPTLWVQGVSGDTLANDKAGKFYVKNLYGQTLNNASLHVLWLYY